VNPNYWLIVGTPANFRISAWLGWTVQGFKSRHGKKAAAMRPGDKLIYYLTQEQVLAGVTTVVSAYFEAHNPLWTSDANAGEDYPWRVHIAPDVILDSSRYLPVAPVADRLAQFASGRRANWTLAFQGNVHLLPPEDGELLLHLIRKVDGAAPD
jgi:hypothetical protein